MSYTYTTLKQAIQDYTQNTETTFVNNLDSFITNAEERLLKLIELDYFRKNASASMTSGNQYLSIPPDYLGEEGLRIWHDHYSEMKRVGVLQVTDMESFGQLCLLHEKVKYADDVCNEEGWVLTNDKGNRVRNPMAIQRADWVRELIQYKTRFGMFPSCRADLQVEKPKTGIKVRKRG